MDQDDQESHQKRLDEQIRELREKLEEEQRKVEELRENIARQQREIEILREELRLRREIRRDLLAICDQNFVNPIQPNYRLIESINIIILPKNIVLINIIFKGH